MAPTTVRTAKVISGFACLIGALLLPGLVALSIATNFGFGRSSTDMAVLDWCAASPFGLGAVGLIATGLFLIVRRHSRFSRRARVLIAVGIIGGVVPALVVVLLMGYRSGALVSNAALVRRIEVLQSQKTNGINMTGYEQHELRRRLVNRNYLVEKIIDMPNTRMETPKSKDLWDAMITFRDKECSCVAEFGMGPADGSADILYVTITDAPNHIPQWKTMLLKWDSGAEEAKGKGYKKGPVSFPSD